MNLCIDLVYMGAFIADSETSHKSFDIKYILEDYLSLINIYIVL